MIEEAYVSFETAKLLKEKGFDEECYQKYDDEGYLSFNHVGYINSENPCDDFYALAPTQQMAMCWLREVYNQHIVIQAYNNVALLKIDYYVEIQNLNEPTKKGYCVNGCMRKSTYEEAVESAIKYCLTNLIK